jgi:apolipoprotein N-acyltransferase
VLYIASVWVLAEWLLHWASKGMPWFLFHMGNALSTNLYAIQSASITGVYGMSFIVVCVNWLLARAIAARKWKSVLLPAGIFLAYMTLGWVLLATLEKNASKGFTVAILSEDIPPDIQWDQANGDHLVRQLLTLENDCIAQHPQMILWSESAIPWTYSPNDDLVRELLHRSASAGITHMLGMNTAVTDKLVLNSAYCLAPDGSVLGRYDKRIPLLLVEQSWNNWLIPFFSANGYAVSPGRSDLPLPTPYGRAGVLICNESALPETAAASVSHGARFLLNMSNDGWFSDTYLEEMHFYNARLRAVETRKDIAVNSNNGRSGFVSASGRIDDASYATIYPNNIRTIAVSYPLLPVYACIFLLLVTIIIHKKTSLL